MVVKKKAKPRSISDGVPRLRNASVHLEEVPVDRLRGYRNHARAHGTRQLEALTNSIKKFGFCGAIVIEEDGTIVAGHARLLAAMRAGYTTIPCISITHLSEDELRAFRIADNRVAELAKWDDELLAIEFRHLLEVGFDVDLTGFDAPEIDYVIETQTTGPGSDAADEIPAIEDEASPISRANDLWRLGAHTLLCGNALEEASYQRLLGGKCADVIATDPPYNVPIGGHVSGKGRTRHREFVMASGEMTAAEYAAFLNSFMHQAAAHSRNGALHYVFIDWRNLPMLLAIGREIYSELLNICIWDKTNAGMGSFYRSQHEMIPVFKVGTGPHKNNVQLGRHGRNRSNVWRYHGANSFHAHRTDELTMHPTVKPVALVKDLLRDCTRRGQVVLDPFIGSGTTLIAAEEIGRVGYGMELDPLYVDVTLRRWGKLTGCDPILLQTGEAFTAVRDRRLAGPAHGR